MKSSFDMQIQLFCKPRLAFFLVYGAHFGSTLSTGAFMLLVKKIPRLWIFEHTVPPVRAQKRSAP